MSQIPEAGRTGLTFELLVHALDEHGNVDETFEREVNSPRYTRDVPELRDVREGEYSSLAPLAKYGRCRSTTTAPTTSPPATSLSCAARSSSCGARRAYRRTLHEAT